MEENLTKYMQNLTLFIDGLDQSSVKFLYLVRKLEDKTFVPKINSVAKKWGDFYIVPGTQVPYDYCYVYNENSIKYSVVVSKNDEVSGYQKEDAFASVSQSGGGILKGVNLGNHLTFGILRSFVSRKPILDIHETLYISDIVDISLSQDEGGSCFIVLKDNPGQDEPNGNTPLHFKGKDHSCLSTVFDDNIIKTIRGIYHEITRSNLQRGGLRQKYITHQNVKYPVVQGNRGGKYININKRRVYLKQLGGNQPWENTDLQYNEAFITLTTQALSKIIEVKSNLIGAIVLDDGSENFCVQYIFGDVLDDQKPKQIQHFIVPKHVIVEFLALPQADRLSPNHNPIIQSLHMHFGIPVSI